VYQSLGGRLEAAPLLHEVLPGLRPVAEAFRLPDTLALAPEPEDPKEPEEPGPEPQKTRVPHAPPPGQALTTTPAPRRPAGVAVPRDDEDFEPDDEVTGKQVRRGRRPRKRLRRKKGGGLGWLAVGGVAAVLLLVVAGGVGAWVLMGRAPVRADAGLSGGNDDRRVAQQELKEPEKALALPPKDKESTKDGNKDKPDNPPVVANPPPAQRGDISLRELHSLQPPGNTSKTIINLAYSPETRRVAGHVFQRDQLALWTLEDDGFKPLPAVSGTAKESVTPVFSPNGMRILTYSGSTFQLWDVETKQLLRSLTATASEIVNEVAFSPDGNRIVSAEWSRRARVWDLETRKEICQFKGHGAIVTRAKFLSDGKRVVSAGWDGNLRVWDAGTGQEIHSIAGKTKVPMDAMCLFPDGKRAVAAGRDGTMYVCDVDAGRELHRFTVKVTIPSIRHMALSPDGTLLARFYADGGKFELRFWDVETGQERAKLGPEYSAWGLAFVDAQTIIASGGDGVIHVWRIESAGGK
jgi:WD40 repeat protein